MSIGFIVPCCIRKPIHMKSLDRCIRSIRKHHPETPIVVIVDYTSKLDRGDVSGYDNVIWEFDTEHVPADMLTHKYFLKNKYFQKSIVIQDSMEVLAPFENVESIQCSYLWHFNNHRKEWSVIEEPRTLYNVSNNIVTHDDLVRHILKNFITDTKFQDYALDMYENKRLWSGCFGCLGIYDIKFIEKLEEQTHFTDFIVKMKSNRLRRAIESIWSLACQYVVGQSIFDSFDGLYYDGTYHNKMRSKRIQKSSYNRQ